MPLTRYQSRNEYGLADPDLYQSADKDDPEALLEGVAMAGLVGLLRQLGDLAEFAAEMFHDLHEEVMATASRSHVLWLVCGVAFESTTGAECGYTWATYPDVLWILMRNVGSPRLFLSGQVFDISGAGACLKRYTDPSFVRHETSSYEASEEYLIGGMEEHPKCTDITCQGGAFRGYSYRSSAGLKLKTRKLDGYSLISKSGESYMGRFVQTSVNDEAGYENISLNQPELLTWNIDSAKDVVTDIPEISMVDAPEKSHAGTRTDVSLPNQLENAGFIEKDIETVPESTHNGFPGTTLTKDSQTNLNGKQGFLQHRSYSEDLTTEADNYVDAPATMESETETDDEYSRLKHRSDALNDGNHHTYSDVDEKRETHLNFHFFIQLETHQYQKWARLVWETEHYVKRSELVGPSSTATPEANKVSHDSNVQESVSSSNADGQASFISNDSCSSTRSVSQNAESCSLTVQSLAPEVVETSAELARINPVKGAMMEARWIQSIQICRTGEVLPFSAGMEMEVSPDFPSKVCLPGTIDESLFEDTLDDETPPLQSLFQSPMKTHWRMECPAPTELDSMLTSAFNSGGEKSVGYASPNCSRFDEQISDIPAEFHSSHIHDEGVHDLPGLDNISTDIVPKEDLAVSDNHADISSDDEDHAVSLSSTSMKGSLPWRSTNTSKSSSEATDTCHDTAVESNGILPAKNNSESEKTVQESPLEASSEGLGTSQDNNDLAGSESVSPMISLDQSNRDTETKSPCESIPDENGIDSLPANNLNLLESLTTEPLGLEFVPQSAGIEWNNPNQELNLDPIFPSFGLIPETTTPNQRTCHRSHPFLLCNGVLERLHNLFFLNFMGELGETSSSAPSASPPSGSSLNVQMWSTPELSESLGREKSEQLPGESMTSESEKPLHSSIKFPSVATDLNSQYDSFGSQRTQSADPSIELLAIPNHGSIEDVGSEENNLLADHASQNQELISAQKSSLQMPQEPSAENEDFEDDTDVQVSETSRGQKDCLETEALTHHLSQQRWKIMVIPILMLQMQKQQNHQTLRFRR
ncbi:hypothetical protein HID58_063691 [Brassica napus]|uniref:Protein SCAR n=1 Tax=Brassica napus TaxID=3708 RepID=A0ABQ7XH77_BRANA|nr:hypothetical protein HID58_063691 [Brassica napus]